jgi:hypothetical protein
MYDDEGAPVVYVAMQIYQFSSTRLHVVFLRFAIASICKSNEENKFEFSVISCNVESVEKG